MSKAHFWGRAAMIGAMVVVCGAACQSVLDIEEPRPLAPAGAAGQGGSRDASDGGTASAGDASHALAGEGGQSIAIAGAGGEGGDAGVRVVAECEEEAVRCGGESERAPQICRSGKWVPNSAEASAECAVACDAGQCVECHENEKRCSVCAEGDETCTRQRFPQTCKDGAWVSASQPCEHYCSGGTCQQPASCAAEAAADATTCEGESCCLSLYVPGGDFHRNYAETGSFTDRSYAAKISPFLLDKFEVTVGRMQQFVAAFKQLNLEDGDGKAPHIASDRGWSTKTELPGSEDQLKAALASCAEGSTWKEGGGPHQKLPANCVDFSVAYAFCVWDGGRLPTDAEWNFAAAGGDLQRLYPWPAPLVGPDFDEEHAVYGSLEALPEPVGRKVKGNAFWGHADMGGNVAEMVLDFAHPLSTDPCNDCLDLTAGPSRVTRGGSFSQPGDALVVPYRMEEWTGVGEPSFGLRCARDIK